VKKVSPRKQHHPQIKASVPKEFHRERRRLCKAYYKTPGQRSKSRLLQIEKEENIAKRDPTESFPVAAAEDVNRRRRRFRVRGVHREKLPHGN